MKGDAEDRKRSIEDVVRDRHTQLPTLPSIVDGILEMARSERSSARDLADFVGRDQAIANKILKLANSAYYGFIRQIDSIPRAITVIGFNEVISLTIGMSVFSAFSKAGDNRVLDMKDMWIHCLGTAFIAKKIAGLLRLEKEQLFLNGLLHDTGKVILAVYLRDEYRQVLREVRKDGTALYRKEKERLGLDHAYVAGLLMERWNFPDRIGLPCAFHHNPDVCPPGFRKAALTVALADTLCKRARIGNAGDPVVGKAEELGHKAGITCRDLETLAHEIEKERGSIVNAYESIS